LFADKVPEQVLKAVESVVRPDKLKRIGHLLAQVEVELSTVPHAAEGSRLKR